MFPPCILVMVLCLQFGGLCNAINVVEMLNLKVELGEPAILPCNGSAYREEKGTVQWEAMGEDVAIWQGGELREGDKFMGRIQLPSEEKVREGDWSVVLQSTMLSDSDIYECILEGRKTLSAVWLTVTVPEVQSSLVVPVGDEVILKCYIDVPRSQSKNELQVWWTKDDNPIMKARAKDSITATTVSNPEDRFRLDLLSDAKERFNLYMSPTLMSDSGEYHCLYKARSSDDPRPGFPERITLTVLDINPTDNVTTESQPMEAFEEVEMSSPDEVFPPDETTTECPTDPIPVHLEGPTQPLKVMTESQPMEAFEGVVTSFPDEGMEETSLQWDTFPWIRIGLIAGVLLVTVIVLCILGALRKI